ncbi:MAG: hypothetical protein U5Q03_05960 [Bacteroidota bacterium]|nr:hypothetical protein [Bacteroidota bacterium]
MATGNEYDGSPYTHYGSAAYPGMFMRSTASELSNFAIMMINEGWYKGQKLLRAESIEEMCNIQYPALSNSGQS